MPTALGRQQFEPSRYVAEHGPAAQYPQPYAATPSTDAPATPLLVVGGPDGLGFARTPGPAPPQLPGGRRDRRR